MMGWRTPHIDDDLLRRIDGVHSELVQARIHIGQRADAEGEPAAKALNELDSWLAQARHPDTPSEERLRLVTKIDAELCLYEPAELLKADHVRIEDRFFRLSETARAKWTSILKEYDGGKGDEGEYRQLLRSLTYEVAQAGANFDRLTAARRKTVLWITGFTLVILLVLGCWFLEVFPASVAAVSALSAATPASGARTAPEAVYAIVRSMTSSRETLWNSPTLSLLLAGMLGAMVFIFWSVLSEEKLRPENTWPLVLSILVRVGFGALYAFVSVIGVLTGLVPLKVPSGGEKAFMFLTLVAVAAGLSDKLFSKVIGGIMEHKKETNAKPDQQER